MIKRNIPIEIKPTSKELAKCFCDMYADEQAEFFHYIATIVKEEWATSFEFQVQSIIDSEFYNGNAKKIMKILGEYANESNV